MSRLPLIGVAACTKQIGLYLYPIVADKHVPAIAVGAGGLPQVSPALSVLLGLSVRLAKPDGRLFSGAPSNAQPHHAYGLSRTPGKQPALARSHATLSLIKAAITAGVPVVGHCSGYPQALRVAASSKFASPRNLQGFR